MPIKSNLLQQALVKLNALPAPLLDLVSSGLYRAVCVAFRTGVLDELEAGPAAPRALAEKLGMDGCGMELLLELLEIGGYVEEKGGAYRNTALTSRWISSSSDRSMAGMWLFFDQMLSSPYFGGYLEDALYEGSPKQHIHDWCFEDPERWEVFNTGLMAYASQLAPDLCRVVEPPPGASKLLDVGGNHGLYALEFCRAHPRLTAEIIDLPEALEVGKETIEKEGFSERISCVPKDITRDDWGDGFDIVLLLNTIHYFSAEQNAALIERAAASLGRGGLLVINAQPTERGPVPVGSSMHRLLSLFWYAALGGMAYSPDEIVSWFEDAGLELARRASSRAAPGVVFLVAKKK